MMGHKQAGHILQFGLMIFECFSILLTAGAVYGQAASTPFHIADLAPITRENAADLRYLDTLGFYGEAREITWLDNRSLTIGSASGVRRYDTDHLDLPPHLDSTQFISREHLSPDGKLYYEDGQPYLIFYDAQTGKAVQEFYTVHSGWRLSPSWDRLALYSTYSGGWIAIKDVSSGKILYTAPESTTDVAFSPDGNITAAVGGTTVQFLACPVCQHMTLKASLSLTGTVYSRLLFSRDGSLLLMNSVGGNYPQVDSVLVVWDVASGKERAAYRLPSEELQTLTFTPDGSTVVALSINRDAQDIHLRAWVVADLLKGQSEPRGQFLVGKAKKIAYFTVGVIFSPGQTRLALPDTGSNTIPIWDISGVPGTWKPLGTLPNSDASLLTTFSPDDSKIAYIGLQGQVRVWKIGGAPDSWVELGAVGDYAGNIQRAVLSPDSKTLALVDWNDCKVRFWDLEAHQYVDPLIDHCMSASKDEASFDAVDDLAFSPDGKQLVTFNGEWANARIWDTRTGAQLSEFTVPSTSNVYGQSIRFTDAGQMLLAIENQPLDIWNVTRGVHLSTISDYSDPFTFAPNGQQAASVNPDDMGKVQVWDVATGNERTHFRYDNAYIESLAFSPDSRLLAVGGANPDDPTLLGGAPMDPPAGAILDVRDASSGKPMMKFIGHEFAVFHVTFSSDGQMMASSSADHTLRLWDVPTGKQLTVLHDVQAATFSADNRLMIAWDGDAIRFYGVPG